MTRILDPGCFRHRGALALRAARGLRPPGPEWPPEEGELAALDHAERCARCAAELAELILVDHALRNLRAVGADERSGDLVWPRIRLAVERSRARARAAAWRWRMELGSAIAAVLIVGVSAGPTAMITPIGATTIGEPTGFSRVEDVRHDRRIELAFAAAARSGNPVQGEIMGVVGTPSAATLTEIYRNYPDGWRPQRKEVREVRPMRPAPGPS